MFWNRKKIEPPLYLPEHPEVRKRLPPIREFLDKFPNFDGEVMLFTDWTESFERLLRMLLDKEIMVKLNPPEPLMFEALAGNVRNVRLGEDGVFRDDDGNTIIDKNGNLPSQEEEVPVGLSDLMFSKLWNDGVSYREFKMKYRLHHLTAKKRATDLGLEPRPPTTAKTKTPDPPDPPPEKQEFSAREKALIRKMWREGSSATAIQNVIGWPNTQDIFTFVEKHDIPRIVIPEGESEVLPLSLDEKVIVKNLHATGHKTTRIREVIGRSDNKAIDDYILEFSSLEKDNLVERVCDYYEVEGKNLEETAAMLDVSHEDVVKIINEHGLKQGTSASMS